MNACPRSPDAVRWYASSDVRTKASVLGISSEGHYGQLEGQPEHSAALGLQPDLARGLSANAGLNYANPAVDSVEVMPFQPEGTEAVLSLRYSF